MRGPRARLFFIPLIVAGFLLLCVVPIYRYLDWLRWFVLKVDAGALSARVRQEQPPKGADEAVTLTFVRSLGIEDRNIRIIRYSSSWVGQGGKAKAIEGWFPLPIRLRQPQRFLVRCNFDPPGQLAGCMADYSLSDYPELGEGGSIEDGTPPPAR